MASKEEEKLKLLMAQAKLRRELPHLYGWKNYTWAREFLECTNRTMFMTAGNQLSKGHHLNQLLLTTEGYKKVADLKIGDKVFSEQGTPTQIVAFPFYGEDEFFRVTFNDGTEVEVTSEHLWSCKGREERFRKEYTVGRGKEKGRTFPNKTYGEWKVISTKDMLKEGGYNPTTKAGKRFVIPITEPVQHPEKDLFDPYYVGIFLGNGSTHSITNNILDTSVNNHCLKYGNLYNTKDRKGSSTFGIRVDILDTLKSMGVGFSCTEKNIPPQYLFGSIEQRRSLLAGLMDTDGTVNDAGNFASYCTTSEELSLQVAELVRSLGGIAEIKVRNSKYTYKGEKLDGRKAYNISVWTKFNPFRSERKAARWKYTDRYKFEKVIVSIESIGRHMGRCISVDNPTGLYLSGREYIVTHNSSTQIRKVIDWATNKALWPSLWRTNPRQFWYLYPTTQLATSEFDTKWMPDFLPNGSMKNHPVYGWREQRDSKRQIVNLHFNSGVTIYFKTYSQDVHSLQGSSVHYVACDEELPEEYWEEINFRRNAVDGYFSMVFTATKGQEIWRLTMEPRPTEKENFPDAWKKQVSIFDCRYYEDGTRSHWTDEKIAQTIALCKSEAEIKKRIYGKFIMDEGRKYVSFERSANVVKPHHIPEDWLHFVGVDIGAGGDKNHPSTIAFIAVKPDFSYGCVYKHWRGDKEITTMSDVANKYVELRGYTPIACAYYDYHAKDFHTITQRMGVPFIAAEKSHEIGEQVLNALFKNKMLMIFDIPENEPIIREFLSLQLGEDKRKSKDDSIDSVRYGVTKIPWDWSKIGFNMPIITTPIPSHIRNMTQVDRDRHADRERMFSNQDLGHEKSVEDELAEWGATYGD